MESIRLQITDAMLGWLLWLPRDLSLAMLAILTATVLVGLRRMLANQDRLRATRADLRRLWGLIGQARRAGDRQLVERLRRIRLRVTWLRVRAELLPLFVSLPVFALILGWGAERLDYLPPRSNQPLVFLVRTPDAWVGQVVHLVPRDDWRTTAGWVQPIHKSLQDGTSQGMAGWTIVADTWHAATTLTLRLPDRTVQHRVWLGRRTYAPVRIEHDEQLTTEVQLRRYRPLGWVGGWSSWGVAPWQTGYLLLTVILFFLGKRLVGCG